MNKVIGIDLGTTNSCVAVIENNKPLVVPNAEGAQTTPSVVAFTKGGGRLVGQAAKRQGITNPQNTIFSAKRLIGRTFSEVKTEREKFPYKIVEGKNGDAAIEVSTEAGTKLYAPEEISAMVLGKLKADAEAWLGKPVKQAVITVPAYFNNSQRQATKDAGRIAGLEVLRVINEPTAASLAYGLDKKHEERIAVYDLGGGTYDISVLEIGDGVFDVKATHGDTELGGDNWDNVIIEYLAGEFKKQNDSQVDLIADPMARQRLKEEAEKAKIALSSATETDINLPFITADQTGPKHLTAKLTRSQFEKMTDSLIVRTIQPFEECLKDAGMTKEELNELVLVGGMTRSAKVIETARNLVGKEPHKGVNPDEVVATGAAIQGGVLQGDVSDILLLDVTPLTLAIETAGEVATPMIERNTTIPTKKSQVFSTYADKQTAVDIKVVQGERPMAKNNKQLGNFRLDGILPAPRGVPQVEVSFDMDSNGILKVTAKDQATNKEQHISITGSSGLSEEDIESAKKEAEKYASEDKANKEKAEAANHLDHLIFQTQKQLDELGDKAEEAEKTPVVEAINKAKKLLEDPNTSVEKLKSEAEALLKSFSPMAEKLYKASAEKQAASKEATDKKRSGEKAQDKEVVDADFEVIDEKKPKDDTSN